MSVFVFVSFDLKGRQLQYHHMVPHNSVCSLLRSSEQANHHHINSIINQPSSHLIVLTVNDVANSIIVNFPLLTIFTLSKPIIITLTVFDTAKVSTQKKNTGLFGNFSQHGGGVFPIPKTQNQKKVPLNHPKIT